MKDIKEILENRKKEIVKAKYPASEGYKILVGLNGFNEKKARKRFFKWCKENDILFNPNNF